MHSMYKVGLERLPRGHSRRRCDTPKRNDVNQHQWFKTRQVSGGGNMREAILNLVRLGFAESKSDHHGERYRLTQLGISWLLLDHSM